MIQNYLAVCTKEILLLGTFPRGKKMYVPKHMCKNNHSCFIQNGQRLKNNPNIHQWQSKKICRVFTQWNSTQQWKRTMAEAFSIMDGRQMHKSIPMDSISAKFQDQQKLIGGNGNISQSSDRSLSEWVLIRKRHMKSL